MKTFEEAMELRRAHSRQECEAKAKDIGRFDSIIQEIAESANAKMFIVSMAKMAVTFPEDMTETDVLLSIIMSAFVNGVIVGMEMEKSE